MDFLGYLKESAGQINNELDFFMETWRKDAEKVNPYLIPLVDATIEACKGGKRVRGVLVKLGYEITSGSYNPEILKPASAFEIFQTAILAHDDIIDKSPLRRGKKTIYQALGGDHYAISQTICLGDVGFFQAVHIISESGFPEGLKNRAVNSFVKTMLETALGEILDIEIPHLKIDPEEQDALEIFHLKTARYSITGPLLLGAILGGGSDRLIESLKKFGDDLGIAYQIQDDILGIFGTESEIGKSVTSDISEGKTTLLIAHAVKNADQSQKKTLKQFYGREDVTREDTEEIKRVFTDTGALDYSRSLALEYVEKARKTIPEITEDLRLKKLLEGMAIYLVERKK